MNITTHTSTNHNVLLCFDCDIGLVGETALERLVQVQGGGGVVNEVRPSVTDLGKFLQIFVSACSVKKSTIYLRAISHLAFAAATRATVVIDDGRRSKFSRAQCNMYSAAIEHHRWAQTDLCR